MALIVALALVFSACTQNEPVQKSPIPEFDFDEAEPGPSETNDPDGTSFLDPGAREVAAGPGWKLFATMNDDGEVCTEFRLTDGGHGGCKTLGPVPRSCAGRLIECGASVSPGQPYYVTGLVAKDVAEVGVEVIDGRRITVRPIGEDAGFPVNFYVVVVDPCSLPVAVSALDGDGRLLERVETHFGDAETSRKECGQ